MINVLCNQLAHYICHFFEINSKVIELKCPEVHLLLSKVPGHSLIMQPHGGAHALEPGTRLCHLSYNFF